MNYNFVIQIILYLLSLDKPGWKCFLYHSCLVWFRQTQPIWDPISISNSKSTSAWIMRSLIRFEVILTLEDLIIETRAAKKCIETLFYQQNWDFPRVLLLINTVRTRNIILTKGARASPRTFHALNSLHQNCRVSFRITLSAPLNDLSSVSGL